MTVLSEKSRKKLSASLKAKWDSGTRKPNPRSTYEKSSATIKAMIADGRHKVPVNTPEQCRAWRAMAVTPKRSLRLIEESRRPASAYRCRQAHPPRGRATGRRGIGSYCLRIGAPTDSSTSMSSFELTQNCSTPQTLTGRGHSAGHQRASASYSRRSVRRSRGRDGGQSRSYQKDDVTAVLHGLPIDHNKDDPQ